MILIQCEEHGNCPQANICHKRAQKEREVGDWHKDNQALAGQGLDPAAEPGLGPALSSNYTAFSSFARLYANQPYL